MKKFIVWDPRDGHVRYDDEGTPISDGVIGRVGEDNVYLTTYADYGNNPRHTSLEVGQMTEAVFSLSGSKGYYQIHRVA